MQIFPHIILVNLEAHEDMKVHRVGFDDALGHVADRVEIPEVDGSGQHRVDKEKNHVDED